MHAGFRSDLGVAVPIRWLAGKVQHQPGCAGLGEAPEGFAVRARTQAEVAAPEASNQPIADFPVGVATQQGELVQAEARAISQRVS